jgi:hypothetical protein
MRLEYWSNIHLLTVAGEATARSFTSNWKQDNKKRELCQKKLDSQCNVNCALKLNSKVQHTFWNKFEPA